MSSPALGLGPTLGGGDSQCPKLAVGAVPVSTCCPRGRLGLRAEERGVTCHQPGVCPPQLREVAASSSASWAPTTAAWFFTSASRTAAARSPACGRCWVGGGSPRHCTLPVSAQACVQSPLCCGWGGRPGPSQCCARMPLGLAPRPMCPSIHPHTYTPLTSSSPSHLRCVLGVSWELASPWTDGGEDPPLLQQWT